MFIIIIIKRSSESPQTFIPPGSYTSPHGPLFPPVAPNTENYPYWFESAFVTFDTIEDRDKELDKRKIPDGKMVRINDVDGTVKYYAYSINLDDWIDVNFVFAERRVTAGEGLSGGGSLVEDITISHGNTGTGKAETYSASAQGIQIIDSISADKFGHVSNAITKDISEPIKDLIESDDKIAKTSQLPRWIVIE